MPEKFSLFERNREGNDVQIPGYLPGIAHLPTVAGSLFSKQTIDSLHEPFHIDDGMAGEHLGKPVGQVAGKTFSRFLLQMKLEMKPVAFPPFEFQTDVKGPLARIPEKAPEKTIRSFLRKQFFKGIPVEQCGKGLSGMSASTS